MRRPVSIIVSVTLFITVSIIASFAAIGVPFHLAASASGPPVPQDTLRPLDATHPMTYFIAAGAGRTGYLPADSELARWAFAAWQRSSGGRLRFAAAPESTALIRLYWAASAEGEYGEMRPLIVGGRRGAAVFIQPDVNSLGEDIAVRAGADALLRDTIVYLTCVHELGHALGLAHTSDFRDIMYYFGFGGDVTEFFGRYRVQLHARSDIATLSGLSDADLTRLRTLYPR